MIIPIVIGFAGVILSSFIIFNFSEGVKVYTYAFSFFMDGLIFKEQRELYRNSATGMLLFLMLGMWQFKRKDVL